MITTGFIIGLMLLTVGICTTIVSIILAIKFDPLWLFGAAVGFLLLYIPGITMSTTPKTKDVLEKRAYFKEATYIVDQDTINVYWIEWKKKNN